MDSISYTTEWSRKNPDKVKANHKKYLSNPDNKQRNNEYKKKWRAENKKRMAEEYSLKTKEPLEHIKIALKRRKAKGFEVTVTAEELYIPDYCPLLPHIKLTFGKGLKMRDTAATVDKIIPSLGYSPGNVQVISYRANRIKNDASLEELVMIGEWANGLLRCK